MDFAYHLSCSNKKINHENLNISNEKFAFANIDISGAGTLCYKRIQTGIPFPRDVS